MFLWTFWRQKLLKTNVFVHGKAMARTWIKFGFVVFWSWLVRAKSPMKIQVFGFQDHAKPMSRAKRYSSVNEVFLVLIWWYLPLWRPWKNACLRMAEVGECSVCLWLTRANTLRKCWSLPLKVVRCSWISPWFVVWMYCWASSTAIRLCFSMGSRLWFIHLSLV